MLEIITFFPTKREKKSPDYRHWKWGKGRTYFVSNSFVWDCSLYAWPESYTTSWHTLLSGHPLWSSIKRTPSMILFQADTWESPGKCRSQLQCAWVTGAYQILWQCYLPDACIVAQFVSRFKFGYLGPRGFSWFFSARESCESASCEAVNTSREAARKKNLWPP